jgi:type IV secretory pathway TrbF-like protein
LAGKALITPAELVADDTADSPAAINIARLLQSLDAVPGDAAITVAASARAKAVKSDAAVATAIEYLDFSDDEAFASAASQLVAVLTADYGFTGVLVDAETARRGMESAN